MFLVSLLKHVVTQIGTNYEGRIKHLNAELTRACNLRCTYCFNDSGKRMDGELEKEQWEKVIDASRNLGAESILFTGGEITTRRDAEEIIRYAIDSGIRTSILTNGSGLRRDEYQEIMGALERIQISLDSANPRIHDARRGSGSWKVARDAIDYVRSQNVPVEISATISEDYFSELEGISEIAQSTGSKVLIRPIQRIGRGEKEYTEAAIEERKKQLEGRLGNIFVADFARYVPILGAEHDRIVGGQGYITVLPDGKIRGRKQASLYDQKAG